MINIQDREKASNILKQIYANKEDAKFPSSKKELIRHQGWKIIDLTKTKRVHASYMLERLPEKSIIASTR